MAKILVLSLVFPPDAVSTAQIMGELCVDLQKLGHEVTVVTTTPHYNRDPDAERQQPLVRYGVLRKSRLGDIAVYHCPMPRKSASIAGRALSWLWFHVLSTMTALFVGTRCDVVLAPSPPLTIGLSAWIVALVRRAKVVYNVQEIYPDIAVRLGVLRNPILIWGLEAIERLVYERSTIVTVIAPGMRRRLLEKGVPANKVQVIPNFVDLGNLYPVSRANEFSTRYGLDGKFVVSYAGNMGRAQGLETVLDAADLLRDRIDIHFLLLGDGVLRDTLGARAAGQRNVTFLKHLPFSMMPQVYGASDLCVVPLAVGAGSDAVPSKVYRILACERPILAVTEDGSDLAEFVASAGGGVSVQPGAVEELARVIEQASLNPALWREKARKGRQFVVERYAREVITGMYSSLIARIALRSHIEPRTETSA